MSGVVGERLFEGTPPKPKPQEREGASHGKRGEESEMEGGAEVLHVERPEAFSLSNRD